MTIAVDLGRKATKQTNDCLATDRTSFGVSKPKKEAAKACLSLHLLKSHIVENHMSRLL